MKGSLKGFSEIIQHYKRHYKFDIKDPKIKKDKLVNKKRLIHFLMKRKFEKVRTTRKTISQTFDKTKFKGYGILNIKEGHKEHLLNDY